nr:immunoglobulin heavy chain junction region [Mus musculus]NSM03988.1 immunoglobulin heavy chain junction region [Mus musculus]NSM04112.1 immunoglobulin heavy chain junction region [Mus musculus]NSM04205.1 immunoglobulin heavy chain junction region [Mus musculus]NSM04263.1 immunoglobulin heavy chain junction region [Mus musculus]
CAGDYFDYW